MEVARDIIGLNRMLSLFLANHLVRLTTVLMTNSTESTTHTMRRNLHFSQ